MEKKEMAGISYGNGTQGGWRDEAIAGVIWWQCGRSLLESPLNRIEPLAQAQPG